MEEQKEQNFYRTILLNDQNDEIKNHQQALVIMDQQNSQKNIANNNNKSGSVLLIEQIVKCFFIMSLFGAGAFVFYKTPIYFSTLEAITFGVSKFQEQKRVETLQDWEKMFGLDSFQEVNDQSYTQEDLDAVFKQMKIFWNPNKKNTEQKKQIVFKRLKQLEKAYQNILKCHNWQ
ncbi:hypothetical protein ABPG72_006735 [Tetrahymena utriculariae]